MNADQVTLSLIKGAIFDLPPADQQSLKACANTLREAVNDAGPLGYLALALVGAQAAVAS